MKFHDLKFWKRKPTDDLAGWSTDELGEREADVPLNRRQRRTYNRLWEPAPEVVGAERVAAIRKRRHDRIHIIGFGRWRRHKYLWRQAYAGYGTSVDVVLAPRSTRRPAVVRAARDARRARRLSAR